MRIVEEIDLRQFNAWGEGKKTLRALTPEQQGKVQYYIEETYPDGIGDDDLNNFLWLDRSLIAHDILGFDDWEDLLIGDDEEQRAVKKLTNSYAIDPAIIEQYVKEWYDLGNRWDMREGFEDWLVNFGADILLTEFPDAGMDAISDYMEDFDPAHFDKAKFIDGFCEYLKVLKEEERER